MPVHISAKARIIASLVVGGIIALIFLALGCRGGYGVIEEERVHFTPAAAAMLQWGVPQDTDGTPVRRTVILDSDTLDEAASAAAFAKMYR